jgi:hypothetical protein
MSQPTYLVAESPGGAVIGTWTADEVRTRLAAGSLRPDYVGRPAVDPGADWRRLGDVFGSRPPRPATAGTSGLRERAGRLLLATIVIAVVLIVLAWVAFHEGGEPKAGRFTPAQRARLAALRPCLPPALQEDTAFKERLPVPDGGSRPRYEATRVGAKLLELGAWCDGGTLRAQDGRPIFLHHAYEPGTVGTAWDQKREQELVGRLEREGVVVVMYRLRPAQ